MSFTYESFNAERYLAVGDIIKQDGKNHKVTKVTKTALAVERYFWFDAAYDKLVKKFGGKNGSEATRN